MGGVQTKKSSKREILFLIHIILNFSNINQSCQLFISFITVVSVDNNHLNEIKIIYFILTC